jgi:hypothetical protein
MTASTCQILGSQRNAEVLKLYKNSKQDDKRFGPSQQELALVAHKSARMRSSLFWIYNMCKHMLIALINITYNNSQPYWAITV